MYLSKTKRSSHYQIVYYNHGKKTSKSTRTSNKQRAEIFFEIFKHNFYESIFKEDVSQKIKLKEFADEYIEHTSLSCSEAYVARSIKPTFRNFIPYCGNIYLSEVTVKNAEVFLLKRFQESKYSAKLFHRVLKAAFNKAIAWEYIGDNPFTKIRLPKIQTKEPIFITYNELKLILNHTNREIYRDIFQFAFFTGLRAGELLNLTWECINLNKSTMTIGNKEFLTKSKKVQVLPVSEPAKKILIRKEFYKGCSRYVFDKGNGFPYTVGCISRQFKRSVRKANVSEEVHLHTLRSSFGSYLLQKGVPISSISKLLGHSSIAVTEKHYASLSMTNLIDAMKSFDGIVNS